MDFPYKRRTRAGKGTAIRNIKLRMSRKLIFVSGLLGCFSGHLLLPEPEFVRHLGRVFAQTPLEIVASVINRQEHLRAIGAQLFGSIRLVHRRLAGQ